MSSYTTVSGDMWDSISKKVYGNERYMDKLIHANPKHCAVYIFGAGTVLDVPDIDTTVQNSSLPPWKRLSG